MFGIDQGGLVSSGALIAAAANQATMVNADHVRLASTEIF